MIRTRKLPLPQAGSRKRESMRSVSPLTRSSMASTIQGGVNTSPWSATRFFDLIRLMGHVHSYPPFSQGASIKFVRFLRSLNTQLSKYGSEFSTKINFGELDGALGA